MKVYWIRHGLTTENEKGTYYGLLDSKLTQKGIEQIEQIKDIVKNNQVVYISALSRARQTAELLFELPTFKVDPRLNERHMGIFEGMHYQEIKHQYPKACEQWDKDWINYCIPEGESAKNQFDRVKHFIKELERLEQDCVIVAHAGTIRMAIAYMLEERIDSFWKFKINPGSILETNFEHNYWYIEI